MSETPNIDGIVAELEAALAEVARLQAEVRSWESITSGLEAHLKDRVAMQDEADPQRYLNILRGSVGYRNRTADQIYAASQHRTEAAEARAAAAEAKVERMRVALKNIVDNTHVGKRGSAVLRSKYGSYPAQHYHEARAALAETSA